MRVAVVTPYYKEPIDWLRTCHESVARQTHPCTHVLVADGHPREELNSWIADHVVLPVSHSDFGNTPRSVGSFHAAGLGCDAIAFLDADCWYREDHVESLVSLASDARAGFVSSSRMLCRPDGSEWRICPNTDPERFVDTNCMMVLRPAFPTLAMWSLMPPYGHCIGDRIMLYFFKQSGVARAHSALPSVYYRARHYGIYHSLGEPVPDGVNPPPDYESAFRKWEADGYPSLLGT